MPVVSASVGDAAVTNLSSPVVYRIESDVIGSGGARWLCVYWDVLGGGERVRLFVNLNCTYMNYPKIFRKMLLYAAIKYLSNYLRIKISSQKGTYLFC